MKKKKNRANSPANKAATTNRTQRRLIVSWCGAPRPPLCLPSHSPSSPPPSPSTAAERGEPLWMVRSRRSDGSIPGALRIKAREVGRGGRGSGSGRETPRAPLVSRLIRAAERLMARETRCCAALCGATTCRSAAAKARFEKRMSRMLNEYWHWSTCRDRSCWLFDRHVMPQKRQTWCRSGPKNWEWAREINNTTLPFTTVCHCHW